MMKWNESVSSLHECGPHFCRTPTPELVVWYLKRYTERNSRKLLIQKILLLLRNARGSATIWGRLDHIPPLHLSTSDTRLVATIRIAPTFLYYDNCIDTIFMLQLTPGPIDLSYVLHLPRKTVWMHHYIELTAYYNDGK